VDTSYHCAHFVVKIAKKKSHNKLPVLPTQRSAPYQKFKLSAQQKIKLK